MLVPSYGCALLIGLIDGDGFSQHHCDLLLDCFSVTLFKPRKHCT